MANGFLTSSPSVRHGSSATYPPANYADAQRFTCPGTGKQEISEIGMWVAADTGTTAYFKMAIFGHDSGNNCPSTMVANSESAEMSHNTTSFVKKSYTYGTKPVLTGGTEYWICWYQKDDNAQVDIISTGGINALYTAATTTYPTWPTDTQWHTHTDNSGEDAGVYVVYAKKLTVTVESSGGDYTTLSAAISGEAQDLTALGSILTIQCGNLEDTTSVTSTSGFTTSATYYLYIKAATSHGGKWNTGVYRMNLVSKSGIWTDTAYCRIEGLQFLITESGATAREGIEPFSSAGSQLTIIDKCIFKGVVSGTNSTRGINVANNSSVNVRATNCIAYDFIGGSGSPTAYKITLGTLNLYNCTAHNSLYGVRRSGGTCNATNVGCASCTTGFDGTITQTTCSTATPTFENEAGDDFRLAAGDTTWRGQGVALIDLFTDDIEGQSRPSTITYFGLCTSDGTLSGDDSDDDSGESAAAVWNGSEAWTCPGTGKKAVVRLGAYTRVSGAASNHKLALYNSAGTTKIVECTSEKALPGSLAWESWNHTEFTPALLDGGTSYKIAHSADNGARWRAKTGASGIGVYAGNDYTGGFPSSLPAGSNQTIVWSLRCGVADAWDIGADEYVSAGGVDTPITPRPTRAIQPLP